jgi:hypothetical protein
MATRKPLKQSHQRLDRDPAGGADEVRTHGLVIANDALYQLSYGPKQQEGKATPPPLGGQGLDVMVTCQRL